MMHEKRPLPAFVDGRQSIGERLDNRLYDANKAGSACAKALQTYLPFLDMVILISVGLSGGWFAGYSLGVALPGLIASAVVRMCISCADGYCVQLLRDPIRQSIILSFACLIWLIVGFAVSLTLPAAERPPLTDFAYAAAIGLALLGALRLGVALLLHAWSRTGQLNRRVAIVGLNHVSLSVVRRIRSDLSTDARIVGVYRTSADPVRVTHAGLLVLGDIEDLVRHSHSDMFDLIIVALPSTLWDLGLTVRQSIATSACDLSIVSEHELSLAGYKCIDHVGNDLTLPVTSSPIRGEHLVHKLMFDKVIAFLLLVLLCPIFVFIMIIIRCDSEGPVFFRQPRRGFKNKTFHIMKFRTMHHHFEDLFAESQTVADDPRVTAVGRWLRRTSLDELPQLFNVLLGQMSLVGPRPHAPGTRAGTRALDDITEDYRLRHRVKPGITGLAQINGCRGALRSEEQLLRRVQYDTYYIEHWSFALDLRILVLTIFRGFGGRNVF